MMDTTQTRPLPLSELPVYDSRYYLGSIVFFALYFLFAVQTDFIIATIVWIAVPALIGFLYYLFKIPGLAIGLMIAATSLDVVGRFNPEGMSIPVTVFHLMYFISLIILVLKKLWEGKIKINGTRIDRPLVLYLSVILISIFWSCNHEEALISFGRLVALILAMYVTLNLIDSKAGLKLVLVLVFIPALALSVYSGKEFLTSSAVEVKNALSMFKLFSRFGATFDNPNYFATFLLLPLCVAFSALAFLNIKLWKRILLFLVPIGIMSVAFIGTFSRSAWVSLFFSYLFIFSYFKNKKSWIIAISVFGVGAAIVLFQTAFFQSFLLRFTSIFEGKADPSSATRFFLINGGIQMFLNSGFLGVGFESFPIEYLKYIPHNQSLGYVHECHTLPIEILAELGLIGISLFVFFIYRILKTGFLSIRSIEDNFLRTLQIGFVAFFVGLLINFLFMPGGILNNFLWIAIGIIFSIEEINNINSSVTTVGSLRGLPGQEK